MYRFEITYLENGEHLTTEVEGEAIEEVLMAFVTANRHSKKIVIGITEI